jgi:hypothetical protein
MAAIRPKANASTAGRHLVRPGRQIPLPPEVMNMLFTENAANSSLQDPLDHGAGTGGEAGVLFKSPRSHHNPWLAYPKARHKPCL